MKKKKKDGLCLRLTMVSVCPSCVLKILTPLPLLLVTKSFSQSLQQRADVQSASSRNPYHRMASHSFVTNKEEGKKAEAILILVIICAAVDDKLQCAPSPALGGGL